MNLFKNNSGAAQKRNLGSKRCVRISISINNEYDRKLSRLSTSCGMSKSEMTDQLLRIALDSPNVIDRYRSNITGWRNIKFILLRLITRFIIENIFQSTNKGSFKENNLCGTIFQFPL